MADKKDVFVLTKTKKKYCNSDTRPAVRVSRESYNLLVDMANDSDMTMSQIANQAINFAYDHLKYEEREEENE